MYNPHEPQGHAAKVEVDENIVIRRAKWKLLSICTVIENFQACTFYPIDK